MQILKTTFFSLALTLGIQIIFFSEFGWAIYRHGTAMLNGKGYILSGDSPIPADGYYYSPSTNQTLFYADYVPFNNNSSTVMLNGKGNFW
jgi:hypothetical protein